MIQSPGRIGGRSAILCYPSAETKTWERPGAPLPGIRRAGPKSYTCWYAGPVTIEAILVPLSQPVRTLSTGEFPQIKLQICSLIAWGLPARYSSRRREEFPNASFCAMDQAPARRHD